MKLLNRGFLCVKHKQAFWDWANQYAPEDLTFSEDDETEASIYLIQEDFFEVEPILEKQFKKIFKTELESVTTDESVWPEKLTMDLFLSWFDVEFGTSVFDLEKEDLVAEKL